jgi:serine/threonine-protein kinase
MLKNYVETLKREIQEFDDEYAEFYQNFTHQDIRLILSTLHCNLLNLFKSMNNRLPTSSEYGAHFWADPSRELIDTIEKIEILQQKLKDTENAFEIDPYNKDIIEKCKTFLKSSGGSTIPPNMEKIELYYAVPIFIQANNIDIKSPISSFNQQLRPIGEGSYANAYTYFDEFYNRKFVVKKAKKDLILIQMSGIRH